VDLPLLPGSELKPTIEDGEMQGFYVDLDYAEAAECRIQQETADLNIEVQGPDGRPVACIDGYEYGPEIVYWEAAASGRYRIIVRPNSLTVAGAEYRIIRREPSPDGTVRQYASQLATQAKRIVSEKTENSRLQAIRLHKEALGVWLRLGEVPSQAAARVGIGVIQFQLGRLIEAENELRQALDLFRQLNDTFGESAMLANLGLVLVQLGQPEAFDILSMAAQKTTSPNLHTHRAGIFNSLAMLHTETGEWSSAIRCYTQAMQEAEASSNIEATASISNNRGRMYLSLGEARKAGECFLTAASLFQSLGEPKRKARALLHLAETHLAERHWPEALDLVDRAAGLVQTPREERLEGDLQRLFGEIAESDGQLLEARARYLRSADAYRRAGSRSGESAALHQAGMVSHATGSQHEAVDLLTRALDLRRAACLRDGQAATLHAIAKIEADAERFRDALEPAKESVSIIEELRVRVLGPELRSSYFARRQHYSHLLIRILIELKDHFNDYGLEEAAFNVSERARARSLLELLNESRSEIRSGVDPGLIEDQRRIDRRIMLLSGRLSLEIGTPMRTVHEDVEREIEALQSERHQTEEHIRASNPAYASLLKPEPLDLDAIQQCVLDEDTTLVQFSLGDPYSYVWIAGKDRLSTVRIASRSQIEEAARRLHDCLRLRPKRTGDSTHAYETQQALSELSDLVAGPIAAELRSARLLISAEGWLQYVPFGALLKQRPAIRLLDDHQIVYVPSASTIAQLRKQRAADRVSGAGRVLIVADPVFQVAGNTSRKDIPYIRPLPFTRIEAADISSMAPGNHVVMAVGFDANRELLTGDLTGYRIIHFGTHALINDRFPELSGLVLARFRRDSSPVEGLLRLPEVYSLRLRADLVVLAACSSALGKEVRGEGLIGIARAFIYAGSASVLATLWEVDDEATSRFMHHFYSTLLNQNATPAEALKTAQELVSAETRWNLPHFWAGFVLLGDWRRA
jgi:CHAT domain-containing protein